MQGLRPYLERHRLLEDERVNGRTKYERCSFYTMSVFRWLARKLMSVMGTAYVWLDKRVKYTDEEVAEVLGLKIDDDLRTSSRYELCRIVEKEFKVAKDTFWNLHSTQKIRFAAVRRRH